MKLSDEEERGYRQALNDFKELLDNAAANGPLDGSAIQHWDYELRDQIIRLEDQIE